MIEEDDDFDDLNSFSKSYISAEERNALSLENENGGGGESGGGGGGGGGEGEVDVHGNYDRDGDENMSANYDDTSSFMSDSQSQSLSVLPVNGLIIPESLINAEDMTAVEKSHGPSGWLRILKNSNHIPNTNTPTEAQRTDYFALCLASHFCTVATFVPTDVGKFVRTFFFFTFFFNFF